MIVMKASNQREIQDHIRAAEAMGDTPMDGGYGYDCISWDPQKAFEKMHEAHRVRKRYEQLSESVTGMMGTSTVNDCVVAHFEHDPESDQPPIVQYVESLEAEAQRLDRVVDHFGGQAAINAFMVDHVDIIYGPEAI